MRKWGLFGAGILCLSLAFIALRPMPTFNAETWRNSKPGRWAGGNYRYQVSREAIAAVKDCKRIEEAIKILGEPEEPYTFYSFGGWTSHFNYDLGYLRQPLLFWEPSAKVTLRLTEGKHQPFTAMIITEKL